MDERLVWRDHQGEATRGDVMRTAVSVLGTLGILVGASLMWGYVVLGLDGDASAITSWAVTLSTVAVVVLGIWLVWRRPAEEVDNHGPVEDLFCPRCGMWIPRNGGHDCAGKRTGRRSPI